MRLIQSNRLEDLLEELCRLLDTPGPDPLAPEIVAVQNPGMGRWLNQQIALKKGISANLSCPLPSVLIWDLICLLLPEVPTDQVLFSRPVLTWAILDRLADGKIPAWQEADSPARYLEQDPDGSRLYQLAEKIADLFDQYLVFRPDMLLAWEEGRETHWQAVLWRDLCRENPLHRARLLLMFLEAAAEGELAASSLPDRICLFGLTTLPPVHLQVIRTISSLTEVHIFHLSPCRQAWDDLVPERQLVRKKRQWRETNQPDLSSYYTAGHPLLASMGRVGREFFSQLQDMDPVEIELYRPPPDSSILAMIQADILDLRQREPAAFPDGDTSILFHRCHNRMREVQALYDHLLNLFEEQPDLVPGDILVMAPDISQYAAAVAGVFGSAPEHRAIPWSLADRSPLADQPVVRGFLLLLHLNLGRWSGPELMDLLEIPALRRAFTIEERDLAVIQQVLTEAGVRWGLDQEQRREHGVDPSGDYSWEYGISRLLMGLLTGPLDHPLLGVLPCRTESEDWLGGLAELILRLQRLRPRMERDHTPEGWQRLLSGMIRDFFQGRDEEEEALLLLHRLTGELAENCRLAGLDRPLAPAIIRQYFKDALSSSETGRGFLNGRLLFCNMVPMRSLPFQVICLLGMDDESYPRGDRAPSFDLMAAKPRPGDRNRRDDDRYLFLEALLSARRQLLLSWVGLDQRDNSDRPPSVLVAELLDLINRNWPGNGGRLVRHFPLQPFSPACFLGEHRSYQELWLVGDKEVGAPSFVPAPLPHRDPAPLALDDLVRFWQHPTRFFLRHRLGLRLEQQPFLLPESETFAPDSLQEYHLTRGLIDDLLAGRDPRHRFRRLQAAALIPRSEAGARFFATCLEKAEQMARRLADRCTAPADSVPVHLNLAGTELSGCLRSLDKNGLISYRPASCKGKDLMRLWIKHLVLLLVRPPGVAPCTCHLDNEKYTLLGEVDSPEQELTRLIELFHEGQRFPLPFFPETSLAWASASASAPADKKRKKAELAWNDNWFRPGESRDPAYVLVHADRDPLNDRFAALAQIFTPILAAKEERNACP